MSSLEEDVSMTSFADAGSEAAPGQDQDQVATMTTSSYASPSKAASPHHPFGVANHGKAAPMNKRQQAAHRARMLALSKQLQTRLQYAVFKVEHGWSKQSLSEVENLFYKHRRASGSGASPGAVASTSPSASKTTQRHAHVPSTPVPNWRTSPTVRRKASTGHTGEAFGGLVTPPASGGTLPTGHDRYKDLFGSQPSFASGLGGQRSPSLTASGATVPGKPNPGTAGGSTQAAGASGKSYADFWSKIGGAPTGNAAQNGQADK